MFDAGCQVIVQDFVSGFYEESEKYKAIEYSIMRVIFLEDTIEKVNSIIQTFQHLYLYGPQEGVA